MCYSFNGMNALSQINVVSLFPLFQICHTCQCSMSWRPSDSRDQLTGIGIQRLKTFGIKD